MAPSRWHSELPSSLRLWSQPCGGRGAVSMRAGCGTTPIAAPAPAQRRLPMSAARSGLWLQAPGRSVAFSPPTCGLGRRLNAGADVPDAECPAKGEPEVRSAESQRGKASRAGHGEGEGLRRPDPGVSAGSRRPGKASSATAGHAGLRPCVHAWRGHSGARLTWACDPGHRAPDTGHRAPARVA